MPSVEELSSYTVRGSQKARDRNPHAVPYRVPWRQPDTDKSSLASTSERPRRWDQQDTQPDQTFDRVLHREVSPIEGSHRKCMREILGHKHDTHPVIIHVSSSSSIVASSLQRHLQRHRLVRRNRVVFFINSLRLICKSFQPRQSRRS